MILKKISIILVSALSLCLSLMSYGEITVIVHPSNSASLDAKTIGKIFLGKSSSYSNGSEAVPINMKEGDPITEEFNDKVLSKSSAQLKSYWSKLVFTGKGTPPKVVSTEQDVIDLVSNNPAMIGYVSSGSVTSAVKSVGSF